MPHFIDGEIDLERLRTLPVSFIVGGALGSIGSFGPDRHINGRAQPLKCGRSKRTEKIC
jgi:hypothetical protein